jgi:N-acetylglucosaminyldiphosphoundecaprenol N-acetyl-beta-D-mannosaminyltransferase
MISPASVIPSPSLLNIPIVPIAEPKKREVTPRPTRTVWGLKYQAITTEETVDWIEELIERRTPSYVITANLNWAMLSHERPELAAVNRDAAGLVADGMPIVWRSRFGSGERLPERVAGSELIYLLAERGARKNWGIYLLGGIEGVAATAGQRLVERYPGLRIVGAECPPFRALTDDEQRDQIQRISNSDAKLLFVAFGQPKGELWIHQHYRDMGIPVSIQLGASFDFIAGTATRAPKFWQRVGLEWAYRMMTDPRRLIPRYTANGRYLIRTLLREFACRSNKLPDVMNSR